MDRRNKPTATATAPAPAPAPSPPKRRRKMLASVASPVAEEDIVAMYTPDDLASTNAMLRALVAISNNKRAELAALKGMEASARNANAALLEQLGLLEGLAK